MSKPPSDDPRDFIVCVRMTEDERRVAEVARGSETLSDWIRYKLFSRR